MAGDSGSDALSSAVAQRDRFRDATEKIRQRADLTAKSVGALGTTVLTAVGIAKFGDIFPFPGGWGWPALVLLVAAFLAMALIVGFFTKRLWELNSPIISSVELDRIQGLSCDERRTFREIYEEFARLNGVPSLAAYQARMHRLQRIADRADEAEAKELRSRAEVMGAEIGGVQARASTIVVRGRAAETISDRTAKAAYVLFAVALLVFAGSADWLDSGRSAEIATAKSCAEAETAGVTDLPDICDDYEVDTEEEETTPAQEVASALSALTKANESCRAAAEKQARPVSDCEPILQALRAASQP